MKRENNVEVQITLFPEIEMSSPKAVKDYIKTNKVVRSQLNAMYYDEKDATRKAGLKYVYNLIDISLKQADILNTAFNKMNKSITNSDYNAWLHEYNFYLNEFSGDKNYLNLVLKQMKTT